MGLDQSINQPRLLLTKSGDDLIIKQFENESGKDKPINGSPRNTFVFRITTLYTLLQDDQLYGSQNGFRTSLNKIVTLDLTGCELGDLPKCLKILGLKNLNLSKNKLTQVPLCLYGGGLRQLENLDLSFNEISIFDIEPDCLSNLRRLKINNNRFENVPIWFLKFRCTNLEEFDYCENKATNYDFLKNSANIALMKIKALHLANSCLIDQDCDFLRTFNSLQYLDISNKIDSSDTRFINKFRNLDKLFLKQSWKELKILKVNNLQISILPENLLWLDSIRELYLSHNHISWIPEGFEYLSHLEVLDITHNELVVIPQEIMFLTNLKILKAAENKLDDFPTPPPSLEVLDLFDNYLYGIENLNINNENLKHIDLEYNFCDMEQHCHYKKYVDKRDKSRTAENHLRILGTKPQTDHYDYNSRHSKESLDSSGYSDCDIAKDEENPSNFDTIPRVSPPHENWDDEIEEENRLTVKNPDVTLSDNEWDGEDDFIWKKVAPRVFYPCEEDWIYEDAD